jgi:hypothetical protein
MERLMNLTQEEMLAFVQAEVKESDIEKMMATHEIIQKFGKKYVVCKCTRPIGYEADFLNSGMALTGILLEGESLRDFIEYRLRMKNVWKIRSRKRHN